MPDLNPPEVLDHLCPLNLRLDAAGQIVHLGPTLSKMGLEALMGETFDNVFVIERPGTITPLSTLPASPVPARISSCANHRGSSLRPQWCQAEMKQS